MDGTLAAGLDERAPALDPAPVALAVAAPLSVVAALEGTGNVIVAFVAYHVLFCLALPLALLRYRHGGLAEVGERLGLRSPSREGWAIGLATGVAMAGSILGLYLVAGEPMLAATGLVDRLALWGVPAGVEVPLFAYMLVFNSGAEELFWRGYLHTEAVSWLGKGAGILVVALAFTSYHVYTLASLLADVRFVLLAAGGILIGAVVWALLRDRYASLVPAMLGHAGATAGYMTVFVLVV